VIYEQDTIQLSLFAKANSYNVIRKLTMKCQVKISTRIRKNS